MSSSFYKWAHHEYLRTQHWNDFKRSYAQRFEPKCVVCGSLENLQLHHHNYDNRFEERDTDVDWLCETCHLGVHGLARKSHISLAKAFGKFLIQKDLAEHAGRPSAYNQTASSARAPSLTKTKDKAKENKMKSRMIDYLDKAEKMYPHLVKLTEVGTMRAKEFDDLFPEESKTSDYCWSAKLTWLVHAGYIDRDISDVKSPSRSTQNLVDLLSLCKNGDYTALANALKKGNEAYQKYLRKRKDRKNKKSKPAKTEATQSSQPVPGLIPDKSEFTFVCRNTVRNLINPNKKPRGHNPLFEEIHKNFAGNYGENLDSVVLVVLDEVISSSREADRYSRFSTARTCIKQRTDSSSVIQSIVKRTKRRLSQAGITPKDGRLYDDDPFGPDYVESTQTNTKPGFVVASQTPTGTSDQMTTLVDSEAIRSFGKVLMEKKGISFRETLSIVGEWAAQGTSSKGV